MIGRWIGGRQVRSVGCTGDSGKAVVHLEGGGRKDEAVREQSIQGGGFHAALDRADRLHRDLNVRSARPT